MPGPRGRSLYQGVLTLRIPERFIPETATCAAPYPANRNLACVRVPGHLGRHTWVSDLDYPLSSTVTWRDHPADCTCMYCTGVESGPTGGGGEPTAASGSTASIVARAPSSSRGPVTSEEE